jgi:hypothetical protein
MENRLATPSDELITALAVSLRQDPMPAAPSTLLDAMLRRRTSRQTEVRRLALGVLGATAALAIGFLAMNPQPSAAAMLRQLIDAPQEFPRYEKQSELQPDGSWKVTWESYSDQQRFHLLPRDSDVETWIVGGKRIDYFSNQGYATIEPSHSNPFAYRSSLTKLNWNIVKHVDRRGKVQWKGLSLDRFDVAEEFIDGRGITLTCVATILGDISRDRVYLEDFTLTGFPRKQVEYAYPGSAEAGFAVNLPKGTHIYRDVAVERERARDQVTSELGRSYVGGVKIVLRGVFVDEWGGLAVLTSGGTGSRFEGEYKKLRVDGHEAPAYSNSGHNPSRVRDGLTVYEPLQFRGVPLVYESADFGKAFVFPLVFDLEVPIWTEDKAAKGGRKFAGYAKFKHVAPTHTASLGQLLSPLNLSIFRQGKT